MIVPIAIVFVAMLVIAYRLGWEDGRNTERARQSLERLDRLIELLAKETP